jgi:glycosyltransferase involved in cell wall biosynthesis
MRVGIWIPKEYHPQQGGSFAYIDTLISKIDQFKFNKTLDICFITTNFVHLELSKEIICVRPFHKMQSVYSFLFPFKEVKLIDKIYFKYFKFRIHEKLKFANIDVVYYLKQGECVIPSFPFIITNWDIGHRSSYAFPELCDSDEFQRREFFYKEILPRALKIIVESDSGKKELMDYTNIGPHKIDVMRLFPSKVCDIKISNEEIEARIKALGLESVRFFYYPAQYWAHKNHIIILKALLELKDSFPDIVVVFCGSDKGNLAHLKSKIKELDLSDNVKVFDFLPNLDVRALYERCISVVFSSFIGPTNMPIIESMQFGIPIVCSDFNGHREILGDAGIYFDPLNSIELSQGMRLIILEYENYKIKVKLQAQKSLFNAESSIVSLNDILLKIKVVRDTWN